MAVIANSSNTARATWPTTNTIITMVAADRSLNPVSVPKISRFERPPPLLTTAAVCRAGQSRVTAPTRRATAVVAAELADAVRRADVGPTLFSGRADLADQVADASQLPSSSYRYALSFF